MIIPPDFTNLNHMSHLLHRPQATSISQGPSLEDLVKSMAISSLQFQETTQVSLQNLEIQMSLMAKEISEIKAQKSGEELEVAPQEPEEPFIDLTIDTQPSLVENAPKVTFHEPIASHILLEDIQQKQCDDKFLIEYNIHERELLGDQVVSLENGNLEILVEMFINDKFVEIISCSKLLIAKVVQSMHPPIVGVSLLAKVVHYVHSSLFKPPWMEEGSRAKDFKLSACWEVTQLNQICYLFLILFYFVLFCF